MSSLASLIAAALAFAPPLSAADVVAGKVVFQLRPGAEVPSAAGVAAVRPALPTPRGVDHVGIGRIFVADVESGTEAAMRDALAREPAVAWAEVLRAGKAITAQSIPNDPFFSFQWPHHQTNDADMDVPEMWAHKGTFTASALLVVAVIDAGFPIATTEPDLSNMHWTNPGEIANGLDDDNNGFVDDQFGYDFVVGEPNVDGGHDHGFWMTSIIGARANNGTGIAGVAPGPRFMHLRAFDDSGDFPGGGPYAGKLSAAASLIYAVDEGARLINNSWIDASGPTLVIQTAVQYAVDNGALCVFATGNDGLEYTSPGDNPDCVAVAGLSANGSKWTGSNYGTFVDVSAGAELVPILDPIFGVATGIGTSGSAALVTGVAAQLLTKDPDLTRGDLKRILELGSVNIDAANPAFAGKIGKGHVNALNSLLLLEPFVDLGFAHPGDSEPFLNGYGGTTAGSTMGLSIFDGATNAPALLILGSSAIFQPALGGTLVPAPQVIFPVVLDSAGGLRVEFTLPLTLPVGPVAWIQAAVADPALFSGAALTNALQLNGL